MITCVGVGPGDPGYLTYHAQRLIAGADLVCGFDSVLNFIASNITSKAEIVALTYSNQVDKLKEVAQSHHAGKQCVVAFMGDIHFSGFQLLERVERACGHAVDTIPGISSAQVLAARGRVCFDETTFVTFHRRGDLEPFMSHLVQSLKAGRNAIVIPRPWDFMPNKIAAYLIDQGIDGATTVEVWESLTGREATWIGELSSCTAEFSDMSIMLIRSAQPMESQI